MRSKSTETPQHNAPNPFAEQPKRRFSHKTKLRVGIIAGVIVLVGAGTWLAWPALSGFFGHKGSPTNPTDTVPEISAETKRKITIQDETTERLKDGGKASAQAYLDDQLKTAGSDEEKAFIMINKSNLASNKEQAVEYAHEAEELEPTYTTASALASLYEANGDHANALKYYKLMLERAPADFQETNPDDYAIIQKKIQIHEEG